MIHVDSSFVIRALCPGSPQERQLLIWLDGPGSVLLSTVAWAELLCGPVSGEVTAIARTLLGEPVPLGTAGAECAPHSCSTTLAAGAEACSIASLPRRPSKPARNSPRRRTRGTSSASRPPD